MLSRQVSRSLTMCEEFFLPLQTGRPPWLWCMGVKGLFSWFERRKDFPGVCDRAIPLVDRGVVVVDGYAAMHWTWAVLSDSTGNCVGGDYSRFVRSLIALLTLLQKAGPVTVICDGPVPESKLPTSTMRQSQALSAASTAVAYLIRNGRGPDAYWGYFGCLGETCLHVACDLLHVGCLQVDGDADAGIAHFARKRDAFAVVSNDTDFLVFGVPYIPLDSLRYDADLECLRGDRVPAGGLLRALLVSVPILHSTSGSGTSGSKHKASSGSSAGPAMDPVPDPASPQSAKTGGQLLTAWLGSLLGNDLVPSHSLGLAQVRQQIADSGFGSARSDSSATSASAVWKFLLAVYRDCPASLASGLQFMNLCMDKRSSSSSRHSSGGVLSSAARDVFIGQLNRSLGQYLDPVQEDRIQPWSQSRASLSLRTRCLILPVIPEKVSNAEEYTVFQFAAVRQRLYSHQASGSRSQMSAAWATVIECGPSPQQEVTARVVRVEPTCLPLPPSLPPAFADRQQSELAAILFGSRLAAAVAVAAAAATTRSSDASGPMDAAGWIVMTFLANSLSTGPSSVQSLRWTEQEIVCCMRWLSRASRAASSAEFLPAAGSEQSSASLSSVLPPAAGPPTYSYSWPARADKRMVAICGRMHYACCLVHLCSDVLQATSLLELLGPLFCMLSFPLLAESLAASEAENVGDEEDAMSSSMDLLRRIHEKNPLWTTDAADMQQQQTLPTSRQGKRHKKKKKNKSTTSPCLALGQLRRLSVTASSAEFQDRANPFSLLSHRIV